MKPLPFPVRIAAGLVAVAVEQARDLPRLVIEFPVTAISQALQAPMRAQQKITELAIKGDRLLGTLYPVEEQPSRATFDEDEPPRPTGRARSASRERSAFRLQYPQTSPAWTHPMPTRSSTTCRPSCPRPRTYPPTP